MNEDDIIKMIKKDGKFDEVHHKIEFIGYRRNKKEELQEVSIDILDMGSEKPDIRYSCTITLEGGEPITGNPASSIDVAIAIAHWYELDK